MSGQVGHARPDAAPAALLPAPVRPVVVPAIAVLLAAVLLGGIVLAAAQSDTASAATELAEGEGVTATLADGSTTALARGDDVPDGATVAAPAGAVLRTRDRDVLLGPRARLTVLDGARQVLAAGFAMVDARRGPGVDMETPAAVVTTPEGAVSRVEPGVVLRVGAFTGDAVEVRAVGRQATAEVDPLRQVQVPVGGLPGGVTPLALTGDAYERRLAPDLVAADRALDDLGRTLDSPGEQGPAVLAALRTALPVVAAGDPAVVAASSARPGTVIPAAAPAPRSEPALAYLLAAAPEPDAGRLAERYTEVRALRSAGGSWGVVAGLVDTPTGAVSRLLDRLLSPLVLVAGEAPAPDLLALMAPPGTVPPGTVPPGSAASGSVPAGSSGGSSSTGSAPDPAPSAGPGPSPSPSPPPDDEDPPPSPPPPVPPPPSPPPLPPPADDPVETVEETVDFVVDTVIGLLPSPPPPPPAAPVPAAVTPERPAPVPSPRPVVPLPGG